MENINLNDYKKLYFIGIGGTGMCPMALVLKEFSFAIAGSDMNKSDNTSLLEESKIKVFFEQVKENIDEFMPDLVIYSAAVKENHAELAYAKAKNITCIERSVALGRTMKLFSTSIAISGTHGKSTTSTMIKDVLSLSSVNIRSVIGALDKLKVQKSDEKADTFIVEACEYVDSFLQFFPTHAVILNIEEDHLDYFADLDAIISSFSKFCNNVKNTIYVNFDDENSKKAVENSNTKAKIVSFGTNPNFDYYASDIKNNEDGTLSFVANHNGKSLKIHLKVGAFHNALNALVALAISHDLGIDNEHLISSIESFCGIKRRLELKGNANGALVYDDYAHHPTEILAALRFLRSLNKGKIYAIFEPHTYSRTKALLHEFADALKGFDTVILADILPIRETNIYNVKIEDLASLVEKSVVIKEYENIAKYIKEHATKDDIVITLGAGTIYKVAEMIAE